jgi:2-polyprenyl-6-methoxyphenol hydroxylase-like FAD-dependent oxidoreductase
VPEVAIIGAGIAGLTLAHALWKRGIEFHLYEAASTLQPLGVGINLLPYATDKLDDLGLLSQLSHIGIETRESVWSTKQGKILFREDAGIHAGYSTPQLSIHRGRFQTFLYEALCAWAGSDVISLRHTCTGFDSSDGGISICFCDTTSGEPLAPVNASVLIACDGIKSRVRNQLYPVSGAPRDSGLHMWRGLSQIKSFLTGASMARIGLPETGKLVAYPISVPDDTGYQTVNWVAELAVEESDARLSTQESVARLFRDTYKDWRCDWLDVQALINTPFFLLNMRMCDRDPLPNWAFTRCCLMGDAAHPMLPLGSNGAGQAILDAVKMAECLHTHGINPLALADFDNKRRPPTTEIVLNDRAGGADIVLRTAIAAAGGNAEEEALAKVSSSYRAIGSCDAV